MNFPIYGLPNYTFTEKLYDEPAIYSDLIYSALLSPYIISPTKTFKHLSLQSAD